MRILVANIPLPSNRFLSDLNESIGRHHQVTHDHEMFWNQVGDFDIIHLHFPEYMTYELQEAYKTELTDQMIDEVEQRLQYWSARATIAVTRHVLLPHDGTDNPQWAKLYEVVYRYVDGVAHFAQPSIDEFHQRYADTQFYHQPPAHTIIPHQNYTSLPNTISRADARRQLGISQRAKVMLAFGAVRNDVERDLILDTFHRMKVSNKVLLVSRWREKLADVSWIRLKYWIRDMTRLYYRLHPAYQFNYGFVEDDDTQLYLNAADVLFIPRLHVLNSGNVTLGMTFGKVVVGPDSLDVGHILREYGNVVFDPDQPESAASALQQAMALAETGQIGAANRHVALQDWTVEQCGDLYSLFFENLVSTKTQA